jgi:myo-inositol-1-phosphate synthase
MHWDIGGYTPSDIEVVAAFDVDARKVGKTIDEAIFAKPNCTTIFQKDIPKTDVKVSMGHVLDGVAEHMSKYDDEYTFVVSDEEPVDVVSVVESSMWTYWTSIMCFQYFWVETIALKMV